MAALTRSGITLVSVILLLCSAAHAAPTASTARSYEVLQRMGLVDKAAAPAAAPQENAQRHSEPVRPEPQHGGPSAHQPALPLVKPAPVSEAADAAEPPPTALARAYNLLRLKGLLPGIPGAPAIRAAAPRRGGSFVERVVVDKSDRKLYLMRGGKVYREYAVSLGGNPTGPKQRAGDEKTPEGTYTLDWRNPNSRFYKSIHISYPNAEDRVRAERLGVDPGGDIMLHGEHYNPALQRTLRRAKLRRDWTEGCIALNNEHIDEIWRDVSDGTPIDIRP